MKVAYLSLVFSYFSLAALAQSDTAYIVSDAGYDNFNGGTNSVGPTGTGTSESGWRNDLGQTPSSSFPPGASSSGSPFQSSNGNRNGDPYATGPYNQSGNGEYGTNGQNGQNNNDDNDADDGFLGFGGNDDDDDDKSSASGGWTPAGSSFSSRPTQGQSSGSGFASGGYITTTLTIAIPVPLNTDSYDPSQTASIEDQSGAGFRNTKVNAFAASFLAAVGAIAGAVLM